MNFISTAYAATEAVAEHTANSGGLIAVAGTLGLNGKLFLAQLINFAVLAVALWYLLFKPLTKYMEERAAQIAEGLNNARKLEEKLKAIEAERQSAILKAEGEGRALVVVAQEQAARLLEKAHTDAAAMMMETRARLDREAEQSKQKALLEIRNQAADLIVLAAEKVLHERIDATADKKLIERALKEVNL